MRSYKNTNLFAKCWLGIAKKLNNLLTHWVKWLSLIQRRWLRLLNDMTIWGLGQVNWQDLSQNIARVVV